MKTQRLSWCIVLTVFLLAVQLGVTQGGPPENLDLPFGDFAEKFQKQYKNYDDKRAHQRAYQNKQNEIRDLNRKFKGKATFDTNQYSDLLPSEWDEILTITDIPPANVEVATITTEATSEELPGAAPETLNYVDQGWITPPKNQRSCGSCWAFAAAGYLESLYLQDGQGVKDISEQSMVECSSSGYGCNGGWGSTACRYSMPGSLIETEFPYDYTNEALNGDYGSEFCNSVTQESKGKTVLRLKTNSSLLNVVQTRVSSTLTSVQKVEALKQRLADNGPIMVALDGGDSAFQSFRSGTIYCVNVTRNHEVLLVGYTSNQWIIKNSWGTWGVQGYGYVSMDIGSDCGILEVSESVPNTLASNLLTKPQHRIRMTGTSGWKGASISIIQPQKQKIFFGPNFVSGTEVTLPVNIVQGRAIRINVNTTGTASSTVGFFLENVNGEILCQRAAGEAFTLGDNLCAINYGCGDGGVEEGEGCDDGNNINGDGCDEVCVVEDGWTCVGVEPSTCTLNCGNSLLNSGEQCDDGARVDGDGCSSQCLVEDGWTCSGTGAGSCTLNCGNSELDSGEECDDGATEDGDGCSSQCLVEDGWTCSGTGSGSCSRICGNSELDSGEECDDGATEDGDGCSSQCLVEDGWTCSGTGSGSCTLNCGNSQIDSGQNCDDSNTNNGDGCSSTCTQENGWTCVGTGPDSCTVNCGNGQIETPEACDDGETVDGDGCSATCTVQEGWTCVGSGAGSCTQNCGNGEIETPEACDDGETVDGDGCSSTCTIESGWSCDSSEPSQCDTCGNGNIGGSETCDDSNTAAGDGCNAVCQTENGWTCVGAGPASCSLKCGNSQLDSGQSCDDGARLNGDGCSSSCTVENGWTCVGSGSGSCTLNCGNGQINAPEACDDGGLLNGDGCSASCTVENGWTCVGSGAGSCTLNCGNGRIDGSEKCDDGDRDNGDGCSSTCIIESGWVCENSQPSLCVKSVKYTYTLGVVVSGNGNGNNGPKGYSGVEIGFVQNGTTQYMGSDFTSGTSYGPKDVYFYTNYQVNVSVFKVTGNADTSTLTFQVKDTSGIVVLSKSTGTTFSKGDIVGTFTPAVATSAATMLRAEGQEGEVVETQQIVTHDDTGYVAAIAVLSTLVVVFIATTVYCYRSKMSKVLDTKPMLTQVSVGSASNLN